MSYSTIIYLIRYMSPIMLIWHVLQQEVLVVLLLWSRAIFLNFNSDECKKKYNGTANPSGRTSKHRAQWD